MRATVALVGTVAVAAIGGVLGGCSRPLSPGSGGAGGSTTIAGIAGGGGASGGGGAVDGGAASGDGGASGGGGAAGVSGGGGGGAAGGNPADGGGIAGSGAGGTAHTPGFAEPACASTVVRSQACGPADQQLCYRRCGPESVGVKKVTCSETTGVYQEMSGCAFDPVADYSCYAIPAAANPACPAGVAPQATMSCGSVPHCTLCNSLQGLNGGQYLDSGGAAKQGWCVCQPPTASGTRTWSCASDTSWPCPLGSGCSPPDPGAGDAGVMDAAATDFGRPPDVGCAGNGQPAQVGSLFAPPVNFPIPGGAGPGGANATAIGVGDVTGDGRADIVVGSYHPALIVYPQTPSGALGPPVSYPMVPLGPGVVGGTSLLEIGDLNGDGSMDVVFDRQDGIGFMPGKASGGLGPERLLPKPEGAIGGSYLAIADLDRDGRSDLVAMPYLGNGVEVRLQNADGALVTAGFFPCARQAYTTLAIGDADGDGWPDIALSNLDGEICLLSQRPGNGFGNSFGLKVGGQPSAVGIGNFGERGCGPAIAFTVDGNRPNSQLGVMTWVQGMPASPVYQGAYDIPANMVIADVDGDGRPDVVVMHTTWLNVGVFRGAPMGGLAAEELYPMSWINSGADRLAIGDVNGDGRPDIVSADFDLAVLYHR